MKARLLTNTILQLLSPIFLIVFFVSIFQWIRHIGDSAVTIDELYNEFLRWIIYISISGVLALASTIMGIVTLAMDKDPKVKGLTIASGILGIFGGAFFAGAIVSLIALLKLK